jgi:polyisoprenyl-teichoic acid--peptidoglycan teichoic acid transferase
LRKFVKAPERSSLKTTVQKPAKLRPLATPQLVLPQRRTRWGIVIASLLGVGILSATAGAFLAVSLTSTPLMQRKFSAKDAAIFAKSEPILASGNLNLPELTRPVNILVLGTKVLTSDLKTPQPDAPKLGYHALVNSFDGMTDTMLLLRFEPATRRLMVLSIPRDTRVDIPDKGMEKINAANYYGGPALAARTTSELLGGVGIDRYITLNVQGVEALVDALGGVKVHVPKDMKYQDDSQHLYINLKAGTQKMNGAQALQLLRFRYDENGDIGRIQRQQMVIRSLMEQTLNPTTVARLPKIISVIQSYVDTNLSVEELVALVGYGAKVNRANTQMLMVPGDFSNPSDYHASYWLPDHQRIPAMMSRYFGFGSPETAVLPPDVLRVVVQDSTQPAPKKPAPSDGNKAANKGDVKGSAKAEKSSPSDKSEAIASNSPLAVAAADKIKAAGYPNTTVEDPYSEPLKVTRIVAQQGDLESAQAVQRALGFGEVRIDATGKLRSDVTIQLGLDATQPLAMKPKAPKP